MPSGERLPGDHGSGRRVAGTTRALVLSCEHGGNRVPRRWRDALRGAEDALASHRGWDPGALGLARRLAASLASPLVATTVTRLLVDANRSEGHPRVFSPWTRGLGPEERATILATHHRPHRDEVARGVAAGIREDGSVLHVGIHTFTPVLDGRPRDVDLGVLYDPARTPEREVARALLRDLRRRLPHLRIRANAPYRGVSDGLTASLRRRFGPEVYAGIELEVGQGLLDEEGRVAEPVGSAVEEALREVLRGDVPGGDST